MISHTHLALIYIYIYIYIYIVEKSGFASHTKYTTKETNTDLLHS